MTTNSTWESPLKGYENAEPLPTKINPDGKSLYNPPGPKSAAYEEFPKPINPSNNAFDVHSEWESVGHWSVIDTVAHSSLLPPQQPGANTVCEGATRTNSQRIPRGMMQPYSHWVTIFMC